MIDQENIDSFMILSATATEFLGCADSGNSAPMYCACLDDAGNEIFAYIKYAGFHEELKLDHLTAELIANQFAIDIGLPAARPCIIRLTPQFRDLLPTDENGQRLRRALPEDREVFAFGSVAFDPVRRWLKTDLVHKNQYEQATNLYLFDTLVENSDRGIANPNLLMSGFDFKVIDFGLSFPRCHDAEEYHTKEAPWTNGGIKNHHHGKLQHIMFSCLPHVPEQFFLDFENAVRSLSDDKIQHYVDMVPETWGDQTACNIVEYLLSARENVQEFIAKVKEVIK